MRLFPALPRLVLLAVLSRSAVRAHDPGESWTMVTLLTDRLELELTMAQVTALQLSGAPFDTPYLAPDNFDAYRARLKTCAEKLYIVTSVRTPLKPQRIDVTLTEEGDITFKLAYPHPAAGRLHFFATFLTKLGEGFGGNIDVSFQSGKDLGWDQIAYDRPNFEVTVPAAVPPPPPTKT